MLRFSVPRTLLAGTAAWLVSLGARPTLAQGFDISRAALNDSTVFAPFLVTGSVPLRDALSDGIVDADTHILVLEAGNVRLALVTAQMAYHHAAQGEIAGEPWMVSF